MVKCAAFTLVHNEKYFLPLWLKYYSEFFGMENLYILDHQSTDGSTCALKCNVRIVEHRTLHDNKWMLQILKEKQKRLLKEYEYVVCSDADEFIIPDPHKYKDLLHYLEYMKKTSLDSICCFGHEVVHQRHKESALDWSKPILVAQRRYWININTYDKPSIALRPLNWSWGKHHEVGVQKKRDEDLLLVHLHRVDFEVCRETAFSNYKSGTCGTKVNQYVGDEFIEYFDNPQHSKNSTCLPGILSKIPKRFQSII